MKNTVKLFNTGTRPVPAGRTREGFPIVLHPGKSISVESKLAEKLCGKYDYVNREPKGIPTSSEKSDKPGKKGK